MAEDQSNQQTPAESAGGSTPDTQAAESAAAESRSPTKAQPEADQPSALRLFLIVLVLAAVTGVAYLLMRPTPEQPKNWSEIVLGMDQSVDNSLADRYTDADGDLVADAPEDPEQWLDPEVLRFTYIPTSKPEAFKRTFADLMEAIGAATGKTVAYAPMTSRIQQLRELQAGKLHIAGLNTGNVPMAVNACGAVPFATVANDQGEFGYRMVLITPPDSPIDEVSDIEGRTLTLTTGGSNSGFKAPLAILRSDFNLRPNVDYTLQYSYGHEQSIRGVAQGRYAVAATADEVIDGMTRQPGNTEAADGKSRLIDADQLRTIYRSEVFPPATMVLPHDLKPELAQTIRRTILEFDWSGTSLSEDSYFQRAGLSQFAPISYQDAFEPVVKIDNTLGVEHELETLEPAR